jgi:hypothetical protein
MKILLIEDDEVLIAILTKSLTEHHYIRVCGVVVMLLLFGQLFTVLS